MKLNRSTQMTIARNRNTRMKVATPLFARIRNVALGAGLLACALSVASARAEDVKAGDLVISQAWSRATPGGAKTGGGFLTIENKGSAPDKLIGASADAAGKIEVHEMTTANGVMKMRPVEGGLAIDPGKTVKLAPGGYHLMMMELKNPLKQGDKLPVTLQFEKAGKVAVTLDVQGVGAPAPGGDMGGMKKMDEMDKGMKM
jgi:copper(I)-binding protein